MDTCLFYQLNNYGTETVLIEEYPRGHFTAIITGKANVIAEGASSDEVSEKVSLFFGAPTARSTFPKT